MQQSVSRFAMDKTMNTKRLILKNQPTALKSRARKLNVNIKSVLLYECDNWLLWNKNLIVLYFKRRHNIDMLAPRGYIRNSNKRHHRKNMEIGLVVASSVKPSTPQVKQNLRK